MWPPATATPLTSSPQETYTYLAGRGYGYGPVFTGLKTAWREGRHIYAEVELPEQAHADAARFTLHPALLDASLHAMLINPERDSESEATLLPFAWSGLTIHATGATSLRVHLTLQSDDYSDITLHITDPTGRPVLTADSLHMRAATARQLNTTSASASLHHLAWPALPETRNAGITEEPVLWHVNADAVSGSVPERARALTHTALEQVQR
ncbi:polyketide synthase dehydratase domain-containing protein, partial [Streptomyces sp. TBY4]|uniref:polyketide synthase dehydratase domain-containing protein n=1 Tax=Streptomyces sp. TBY4 TaxID=2962030 RepID=UPI0020B8159A